MKFRKKPVVIEAWQYLGWCEHQRPDWLLENESVVVFREDDVLIKTLEGDMIASPGDWIIRGVKGELYPIKNDIFEATYEYAADEADCGTPVVNRLDNMCIHYVPEPEKHCRICHFGEVTVEMISYFKTMYFVRYVATGEEIENAKIIGTAVLNDGREVHLMLEISSMKIEVLPSKIPYLR
jgi:hypothetical protein